MEQVSPYQFELEEYKNAAPKSLGALLIQMRYGLNKLPIDLENRLME